MRLPSTDCPDDTGGTPPAFLATQVMERNEGKWPRAYPGPADYSHHPTTSPPQPEPRPRLSSSGDSNGNGGGGAVGQIEGDVGESGTGTAGADEGDPPLRGVVSSASAQPGPPQASAWILLENRAGRPCSPAKAEIYIFRSSEQPWPSMD